MENNSKLSVNGEIEQKTNVGRYVASQQRMNLTQVNLTPSAAEQHAIFSGSRVESLEEKAKKVQLRISSITKGREVKVKSLLLIVHNFWKHPESYCNRVQITLLSITIFYWDFPLQNKNLVLYK